MTWAAGEDELRTVAVGIVLLLSHEWGACPGNGVPSFLEIDSKLGDQLAAVQLILSGVYIECRDHMRPEGQDATDHTRLSWGQGVCGEEG